MANTLFPIQAYLTEDALPLLSNSFGVTRTMSKEYSDYKVALKRGARGATTLLPLPTRSRNINSIPFDATTEGSFAERQFSITVNKQKSNPFMIEDVESAVYSAPGIVTKNTKGAINEVASAIEQDNILSIATAGYRFFGDVSVTSDQLQTVGEVDEAVNRFQGFGSPAGGMAYFVVPYVASSRILQTAYQQFVNKRNDELSLKGEIGMLGGVEDTMFMKSSLLPVHTAGTAANDAINTSTGYDIVSVTPNAAASGGLEADNTSVVVLENMTVGTTIVADDMIDIGVLNTADPLRFLTFTGYALSESHVQGRVITGGTVDGSGDLTITIAPALIYDGTATNPYQNLNRDIVAGTDTMRIAKSHRAGLLYFGDYMYFMSPDLPDTEPFPSSSMRDELSGCTLRAYYGTAGIGSGLKQFVHDSYTGAAGAPEGAARLLFPLN